MQILIYFSFIFAFTFFPLIGILLEDDSVMYGLNELKTASLTHLVIFYMGFFLAFYKIRKKNYFWKDMSDCVFVNAESILIKASHIAICFTIVYFFIKGRLILGGVERGIVRTSLGIFGPLVTFLASFGMPAILSVSTVVYFYCLKRSPIAVSRYRTIIISSILIGVMAGGKSNVVIMFFAMLLQGGGVIRFKYLLGVVIFGVLSIIVIGMFQMDMSFIESFNYNIYRAISLSNMGTLSVWNEFPNGSPDAYISLLSGFGEKIIAYLFDVNRYSVDFLRFSLPRYITYLYYGNPQGAIDGTVNLTITAFGETIYWFGREYYYIGSILFSFLAYKVTVLIFISRKFNNLLQNSMYSVFFVSLFISWLNSTSGCFIAYFFGFTSLVYLLLSYLLLKYLISGVKKQNNAC